VWYHTCPSRGKNCSNRLLVKEGGCCIWYDEINYLQEIEDHLGCTISQIPKSLDVPVDEFEGKVIYGDKRKVNVNKYKGHVEILAPSVKELIDLETKTQIAFLNMKYNQNIENYKR
jgi:ATP-dependent RNA helicase DDX1